MSPIAQALAWGTPIAVTLCAVAYFQKRTWLRPPRNEAAARFRGFWSANVRLGQLGVFIADRFVYQAAGHILGPVDGAKAQIEPWDRRVVTLAPTLGWAVITFADGTQYRHAFAMIRLAEAQQDLARFQVLASTTPAGVFKRTRPAHMTP